MADNRSSQPSSFRDRLNRLFSGTAVVRKTKDNKLKVIDPSTLQSEGVPTQPPFQQGYYTGLHTYKPTGYYTPNTAMNFNTGRIELYRDYEAMDEDPILSSALDIYADESTIRDVEGFILSIKSSNSEIKEILYNLFYDILNIEFNLWPWIRNTCKYGDFYLALDLKDELGIVNVSPMSPYDVVRAEGMDQHNLQKVKFYQFNSTGANSGASKKEFDYFEVAHFRLLSDTNFLPYGRSMLEAARKEFKRLALMEDAMMIHRIMRAPQRRIYKVNVGNLNPTEIDAYMQKIMDQNKKIPYIDENTGQYNLKFNLQNMIEDIYIPVRGGDSQTEVETLDGLSNEGMIEDVEYVRNKMMAALKIPKAFLGYEEALEGKAVLAAEDVRFARTIERIQKIIESEFNKLAIIHLYLQGYTDHSLIDFELTLNNPSIVYERQKIEVLNEKIQLVTAMRETSMFSRKYIYETILGLSVEEWLAQEESMVNDKIKEWGYSEASTSGTDPFSSTGQSRDSQNEEDDYPEGFGPSSSEDNSFNSPSPFSRDTFEPSNASEFSPSESPNPEEEYPESTPSPEPSDSSETKKEPNPKAPKPKSPSGGSAFGTDVLGAKGISKGLDLSNFDLEKIGAKYRKDKPIRLIELLDPDND